MSDLHKIKEYLQYPLQIQVADEIASTSTALKQLGRQGAPEGVVLVADSQTGGRGRSGRSFFSPPGCGIYMSLLLCPDMLPQNAALLTAAAAVAVSRAIQNVCGVNSQIKWVNDIFVKGKKCCGILTEADIDPDTKKVSFAVVGIGINVMPPKEGFPREISNIAGSVLQAYDETVRPRLAAEVLNLFMQLYREGNTDSFLQEYRDRSMVIGQNINILKGDIITPAFAKGIDDNCNLVVTYPDGREEALSSGEISIRVTK